LRESSARASGLDPAETDTVAWLVEHHLLMSEIAQSRDIQDPETAKAFADVVQSPQRLALLMILTACDIRAVGPGVWTGWKGSLLRALYYATEPLLSGGHSQVTQRDRIEAAQAPAAQALERLAFGRCRDLYSAATTTTTGCAPSPSCRSSTPKMIRAADQAGQMFAGSIRVKAFEGITEVSFYTPDHPRLLSLIAGACTMRCLDHRRADLLDPRRPGARYLPAAPQLHLGRGRKGPRHPHHRYGEAAAAGQAPGPDRSGQGKPPQQAAEALCAAGAGGRCRTRSRKIHRHRGHGPRPHGPFAPADPQISDLNLTIGSAHIGTYGEKAVDVFYVTDLTGHKIESKPRQKKIHDALLGVFHPRAEAKVAKVANG
jgi:[protein-PII] uridylyltransferase